MGKHKILGVGHLPPPVHGASLMTEIIKREFESYFEQVTWVNLSNSVELKSIGRVSFRKILSIFQIYLKTLLNLVSARFDICYITTTSGGVGFLKDIPIIFLAKIRAKRTILHFHNRGFFRYQRQSIFGYIFRKVLNGCELWLLSERLIRILIILLIRVESESCQIQFRSKPTTKLIIFQTTMLSCYS